MNKQIKGAAFAVCAGAMLVLAGCGDGNSPEKVALDAFQQLAVQSGKSNFKIKVQGSKVTGDDATVTLEVNDAGKVHTETCELKKIEGKWFAKPR